MNEAPYGQPGVAGADGVAPVGFQIVEEIQHQRRVHVVQAQRRRLLAGLLLGEGWPVALTPWRSP
jgi:hypothetical protein